MAEEAFSKLAQLCKVGESMEDFKKCLTNSAEPWLLILDNADDPLLDISRFFPVGNRGTIIVTSRNPECRCHATVGSRELRDMESDEAITLLLRCGDLPSEDEDLRRLAQPIAQTLGYLALAVSHAGAFIRQRICSLEDYLDKYTSHRKKLLSRRPVQAGSDYYKYTVYTTWEMSVDSIKKLAENSTDNTAANALEFLTLFGFCHFDDITEGIFKSAWEWFVCTRGHPWWASNLLGMIRDRRLLNWDSLGFNEVIHLLSSYSLIHVSRSTNRISLHPLVHSWIRDSLDEEMRLRWWNITVSTLALASDGHLYDLQKQLQIHLRHCIGIGQIDDLFLEDDFLLDRVAISSRIIVAYHDYSGQGALALSERAFEYSRRTLGDECYSSCLLSYQLALALNNMSEFQKAADLLQNKIDVSIRVSGPADFTSLLIISELSWAYRFLDRKQEALDLAQKSLRVCEELLDERDVRYVRALRDAAEVYGDLGRYEEAVDFFKKALARMKEMSSEEDRDVLRIEHYLAWTYSDSGQHRAALEMFQDNLKKCSKVLVEDHLDTLLTMVGIAMEYGWIGHPEKGIPLMVKALDAGKRAGVGGHFLEGLKEDLEWLESRSAKTSMTVPKRLFKPQRVSHLEGKKTPGRKGWRLWPKTRRLIAGPS